MNFFCVPYPVLVEDTLGTSEEARVGKGIPRVGEVGVPLKTGPWIFPLNPLTPLATHQTIDHNLQKK